MTIESAMVAFLVGIGMSETRAKDEANRAWPRYSKIITQEHNEKQVQMEFFSMPRPEMARKQGCHRVTIYRRRKKIVALFGSLATPA